MRIRLNPTAHPRLGWFLAATLGLLIAALVALALNAVLSPSAPSTLTVRAHSPVAAATSTLAPAHAVPDLASAGSTSDAPRASNQIARSGNEIAGSVNAAPEAATVGSGLTTRASAPDAAVPPAGLGIGDEAQRLAATTQVEPKQRPAPPPLLGDD